MDLILINSSKLKIMLSPTDMTAYSLTCDNIEYDNTESRRAFWDILNVAKRETGFDAANNRIFIQVYPSKDGGCEMYITKIPDEYDKSDCCVDKIPRKTKNPNKHRSQVNIEYDIYSFCSFANLLNACRQLIYRGYDSSSSIWADDNRKRYYLALEKSEKDRYIFLDEYGVKHYSPVTYTYIFEHFRCICMDEALEKIQSIL